MCHSAAASDTTSTTLMWWTLAMVAFPQVQRRAQAELDAVVGRTRLPTFADAPHLPYVRAVIKEVLRWRPAIPLGMPHKATEDDWYDGMWCCLSRRVEVRERFVAGRKAGRSAGSVGGVERKGIRVSRAEETSKRCEDTTQKDVDLGTVLVFKYILSTL